MVVIQLPTGSMLRLLLAIITMVSVAQLCLQNSLRPITNKKIVRGSIRRYTKSVIAKSTGTVHIYLRQGTSYQCRDPDPHPYPDPDSWPGSPPKFNRLFIGPLSTFPENFIQICSEVFFCAKLLTDRQRKTNRIISLVEVIIMTLVNAA